MMDLILDNASARDAGSLDTGAERAAILRRPAAGQAQRFLVGRWIYLGDPVGWLKDMSVYCGMPVRDPISASSACRRCCDQIDEATGLPNVTYTSDEYFRYERDAVFGRTWAGIAFTDTIPDRPTAHPIEFMGLPLLVTRDRHGALHVFHNVCSHRGMKLVAEPTEVRGLITCRYHCWSYATNGDLKATPNIGGVDRHHREGFKNSDHGLKPVRSAVFMGVLFVNLSGDAPELRSCTPASWCGVPSNFSAPMAGRS